MRADIQIHSISAQEFYPIIPSVVRALDESMRTTPPWNSTTDKKATSIILRNNTYRRGFGAVFATEDIHFVGLSTYMELTLDEIETPGEFNKGQELRKFLEKLGNEHDIHTFICLDTTFVTPPYRRQHVATNMRQLVLNNIAKRYPNGAIVFTQHLADNPGIIKSSISLGFTYTAIEANTYHPDHLQQHWYKIIPPIS